MALVILRLLIFSHQHVNVLAHFCDLAKPTVCFSDSPTPLTHSPIFLMFFFFFSKRGLSHTDRLSIKYDLTIGFPLPVNICPLMWAHRCCQSQFCPRSPVRNQFKRRGRREHQQRINVLLLPASLIPLRETTKREELSCLFSIRG